MRRTLGALLAATALVAGGALASCAGPARTAEPTGSADPDPVDAFVHQPAEAILKQALARTRSLNSMRASGTLGLVNASSMEFDLRFDTEGTCLGTMQIGTGQSRLLRVGGGTYLKANRAFWRSWSDPASARHIAATLHGRWAKVSRGEEFDRFCEVSWILDHLGASAETTTVGAVVESGGQPAVELFARERNSPATTTIWVAVEGDHEIVAVQRVGGFEPGRFALSEFDEPVPATAPTKEEYLDLSGGSATAA